MADTSSSLTITELTGDQHELEFFGRSLPYKPWKLTGKMSAEFTHNIGSPIKTVQVLGADEADSHMNGMWKAKYISGQTDLLTPSQQQDGLVTLDGVPVRDAFSVHLAVDAMRRRGQLIEVRWDGIVRQGLMVEYSPTIHSHEDIAWELGFEWISQGDVITQVAFGIESPSLDIANQILSALNALKTIAEAPFAIVQSVKGAIESAEDVILAASNTLNDIANKASQAALTPLDAAKGMVTTLKTVQDQAHVIENTLVSVPARAIRSSLDIAQVTASEAYEAGEWARQTRKQARDLRYLAARLSQQVTANSITQPVQQTFIANEDQDLREVSRHFYGSPDSWRALMLYNGLSSSKLSAGMRIYVPQTLTQAQAGT